MSVLDLAGVTPGFADPAADSQGVFRGCLAALSRPGEIVELDVDMEPVPGVHRAALALLLALLDQDTRLWLSPSVVPAATTLKFHTGCTLAAAPGEANFALVRNIAELPALERFAAGSDFHPERSATVLLQVPDFSGARWTLTGPGIAGAARLEAPALGADFLAQWRGNHARFPCGVDLFLVSGARLCGLPRTTRIAVDSA